MHPGPAGMGRTAAHTQVPPREKGEGSCLLLAPLPGHSFRVTAAETASDVLQKRDGRRAQTEGGDIFNYSTGNPSADSGDEQRSSGRARQAAANQEQAGGDGGHRGTRAEDTGLSKNASCRVHPPPLQHLYQGPGPPREGPSLRHTSQPSTHSTQCCGSAQQEEGGCTLMMYSPEKATLLRDSVRPAPPRAPHISAGSS